MQACVAIKIKGGQCTNPQKFGLYCGVHKSKNAEKVEVSAEEFVFFCKIGEENDYLSNWYATPFELGGVKYPTVEHYMMYQKAILMKDQEIANKILTASTPAQVKALGRKVKNFDEKLWCEKRFDIVYEGNLAKYQNYPALKAKLLETGSKTLVEAADYDKIYGIGLTRSDPRAQNRKTWCGQNLLGQILMKVRDTLRDKK